MGTPCRSTHHRRREAHVRDRPGGEGRSHRARRHRDARHARRSSAGALARRRERSRAAPSEGRGARRRSRIRRARPRYAAPWRPRLDWSRQHDDLHEAPVRLWRSRARRRVAAAVHAHAAPMGASEQKRREPRRHRSRARHAEPPRAVGRRDVDRSRPHRADLAAPAREARKCHARHDRERTDRPPRGFRLLVLPGGAGGSTRRSTHRRRMGRARWASPGPATRPVSSTGLHDPRSARDVGGRSKSTPNAPSRQTRHRHRSTTRHAHLPRWHCRGLDCARRSSNRSSASRPAKRRSGSPTPAIHRRAEVARERMCRKKIGGSTRRSRRRCGRLRAPFPSRASNRKHPDLFLLSRASNRRRLRPFCQPCPLRRRRSRNSRARRSRHRRC